MKDRVQQKSELSIKIDLEDPVVIDLIKTGKFHGVEQILDAIEGERNQTKSVAFLPFPNTNSIEIDFSNPSPEMDDNLVGSRLGEYILKQEIGRGGFGRVYLAEHNCSKKLFAIKVVNLESVKDPERFDIERMVMQKLSHPNIVSFVDFGKSSDNIFYLVMSLIVGQRLDHFIEERRVTPQGIALIFADVASGLQYAHEIGVVHRDLKPSNILVTDQGNPMITDFGLAKTVPNFKRESEIQSSITSTGMILGTLGYLAPEQLGLESKYVSQRTDIYGFGATLFKVLTGRTPFESKDFFSALREIESHVPGFTDNERQKIPKPLRDICIKCLEKLPQNRYESMEQLRKTLIAFANGERISVPQRPFYRRINDLIRSEPLIASLTMLSIGVLICGLITSIWFWNQSELERRKGKLLVKRSLEFLNLGDAFSERLLSKIPNTHKSRQERLTLSTEHYDYLLNQFPNDIELLRGSALSYYRLAMVSHQILEKDAAFRAVKVAEQRFETIMQLKNATIDDHFDLFHTILLKSFIQETNDPAGFWVTNAKATKSINYLVEACPLDTRFLDAQLFIEIKTLAKQGYYDEQHAERLYKKARILKSLKPVPCLEWRHEGTAARLLAAMNINSRQYIKAAYWILINRQAVLGFLQRPNSHLDDLQDWIQTLELESKIASLHGDFSLGRDLHEIWREELKRVIESAPDRPSLRSILSCDHLIFQLPSD